MPCGHFHGFFRDPFNYPWSDFFYTSNSPAHMFVLSRHLRLLPQPLQSGCSLLASCCWTGTFKWTGVDPTLVFPFSSGLYPVHGKTRPCLAPATLEGEITLTRTVPPPLRTSGQPISHHLDFFFFGWSQILAQKTPKLQGYLKVLSGLLKTPI